MEMNIAVIPGDGIGPEITTAAIIVLEAIAEKYGHVLNLQYVKACSQSVEESGNHFQRKPWRPVYRQMQFFLEIQAWKNIKICLCQNGRNMHF